MSIQLELFAEDEVVELETGGKVVRLRMMSRWGGGVDLLVVDKDGEAVSSPFLLRITSEGVYRQPSVNSGLGLPLTDGRRLTLVGER